MSAGPVPLRRFALPCFGFKEPTIHGAATVRASCLTVDDFEGGSFASLRLSFIDPRGRHATMVAYFDAAATAYAHALAREINAVAAPEAAPVSDSQQQRAAASWR